jgi:hypothetical protein
MTDADLMKQFGVEWIASEFAAAAETLRHYHSPQCWPAGCARSGPMCAIDL